MEERTVTVNGGRREPEGGEGGGGRTERECQWPGLWHMECQWVSADSDASAAAAASRSRSPGRPRAAGTGRPRAQDRGHEGQCWGEAGGPPWPRHAQWLRSVQTTAGRSTRIFRVGRAPPGTVTAGRVPSCALLPILVPLSTGDEGLFAGPCGVRQGDVTGQVGRHGLRRSTRLEQLAGRQRQDSRGRITGKLHERSRPRNPSQWAHSCLAAQRRTAPRNSVGNRPEWRIGSGTS